MAVYPRSGASDDEKLVICSSCKNQLTGEVPLDANHWRCLNESMWNPVPAIQVISYRMLERLHEHAWALELKNQMYMDEATLEWARHKDTHLVHKDAFGNLLNDGDTVSLVKDLAVKGAGFTAKRGTAVRRIRCVHDNENHIEGKVNGQTIIILTQYVKKMN